MEIRIAVNSAVFAFILSLLSFLHLLTNLRYVPMHLAVIAMLLGVMVGAISGFAVAKRQLKFLTENGETRVPPLSTILFLVGGLLILLSFWVFFAFNASIGTLVTVTDFAYPTLSAFLASEAILFLRWERKHRKLIIAGMWRFYVSPKTD